tara:strand:+ start:369 stop:794 length:426 start_codon:yes stop_codon:yes gene_type:complete
MDSIFYLLNKLNFKFPVIPKALKVNKSNIEPRPGPANDIIQTKLTPMPLPNLYSFTRRVSVLLSVLGCLLGLITTVTSFSVFEYGFMAGLSAISGGALIIFSSLISLGLILCFLDIVKSNIDSRNLLIELLNKHNKQINKD